MKTLKVGVVGAGFVSNIHLDAYRRVSGDVKMEVVGITAKDNAEEYAKKFGIGRVYRDFEEMIADPEIDVVDICVPNVLHADFCVQAANAGKHIICEKPLTGGFGVDSPDRPAGKTPKKELYFEAMKNADRIVEAARKNNVKICYAEDFVYAPVVEKAKRILKKSGGAILEIRTEESHSGSHADYSRHWRLAGGGSLLRMGSHPIGLALHLKRYEGLLKYGKPIEVKSVVADVATLTHTEAFQKHHQEWIVDKWQDVEDWSTVVITFEDDTKALISANDTTLGGIVNTLDIFTTNTVLHCNMASNDSVKAYTPSASTYGDEYISEKIETTAGWTFPSPDEDYMRGYPQEMQDFAEAIAGDRDPISDGELGRQVVKVIYAAYISAETGTRVELADL
ncbi:Gfo/Idh/MocA family protein [Feifania hominis]|uniref:Gfo/Idh/MocA family oxidoreductase n=1 Tax=Feifania hominis TaxID=2763660 RepID=A0A926DD57_9FIRM|nr:Gfo/Idh/MocA family oxidoreductase [Feifania hominis]MBC8535139.1 Gfo/Idh/MocA family oxidoreductase [Feifania hominis]